MFMLGTRQLLDLIENTPTGKFLAVVFAIYVTSASVALTVAWFLTR
jgi:hypothetical protein